MNYHLLQGLLVAVCIGALIGAQRERDKVNRVNIGGFRTYILVSLLGALTALLMFYTGVEWIFGIVFLVVGALTIVTYVYMANKDLYGVVTEYLVFLTFILGFLAFTHQFRWLAIVSSVAVVLITEFGNIVHKFIQSTSKDEWVDTLRFIAVVFLIYPLLPQNTIDPWGLINPAQIWLLVILISGVQFVGYYLIKTLGTSKGILLNAFMGGLVSSTATTSSMSILSNKSKGNENILLAATMLTNITKIGRIMLILAVISPVLFIDSLPFLVLTIVGAIVVSLYWYAKSKHDQDDTDIELGFWSPFQFLPALKMALLFTGIKILAQVALDIFGNSGLVITTALSGLIDVDAISMSIASLFNSYTVGIDSAVQLILLAVISNSVLKSIISVVQGEKQFGRKAGLSFGIIILFAMAGIVATAFV